MFDLPLLQTSTHLRTGGAQCFAEVVATLGLVLQFLGPCAGIQPVNAPDFILARVADALLALVLSNCLFKSQDGHSTV
ncbi:MAG: hypothetical protein ACI9O0_000228 [Paracoccaceae bacterium]|jgi:hypothetical protein